MKQVEKELGQVEISRKGEYKIYGQVLLRMNIYVNEIADKGLQVIISF